MRVSHDDSYLYTVGADGCICVFDIKGREHTGFRREKDMTIIPPSEEIIITKAEVDELNLQIETLGVSLTELQNHNKL
jgi:hypothetical protein